MVMGMSSRRGFGKEGGRECWGVSTLGGLSGPTPSLSQPLCVHDEMPCGMDGPPEPGDQGANLGNSTPGS